MSDDDCIIESRSRFVVGYFVGRNWYHERRNTRSAVPSPAKRYGCGLYCDGTVPGFLTAKRRILNVLKATARLLETGEVEEGQELACEWPSWTHVVLLDVDRFSDGNGMDGGLP